MLTFDDLVRINKEICTEYGQTSLVINKDNLLSALSVQDFDYHNLEYKAAKLFRNIVVAHGFQDANKRTACVAVGLLLPPSCDNLTIAEQALKIAKGQYRNDVDELVKILYSHNLNESFNDLTELEQAKVVTIVDEKYNTSVGKFLNDVSKGGYDKSIEYTIVKPKEGLEIVDKDVTNGLSKVILRYYLNTDTGKLLVYVDVHEKY